MGGGDGDTGNLYDAGDQDNEDSSPLYSNSAPGTNGGGGGMALYDTGDDAAPEVRTGARNAGGMGLYDRGNEEGDAGLDKAKANLDEIKTIEGDKSEAYKDLAKALGV